MIILEGPSCAGKTRFAQWLMEKHDYICFQHEAYDDLKSTVHLYQGSLLHETERIVLDGSWYGELVRNIILRYHDPVRITAGQKQGLETLAMQHQAVVVLLQPTFEVCVSRWRRTLGSEFTADEQEYVQSYRAYQYAEWFVGLPTIRVGEYPISYGELLQRVHKTRNQSYMGEEVPIFEVFKK